MVYPLPAVMVTSVDSQGKPNIMTAAWTGTICSDPAMAYVSIRKERYSHGLILSSGEYVINLTNEELVTAAHALRGLEGDPYSLRYGLNGLKVPTRIIQVESDAACGGSRYHEFVAGAYGCGLDAEFGNLNL